MGAEVGAMLCANTMLIRASLSIAQVAIVAALCGQDLSPERAVKLAELFVRENGYTDAPDSAIKSQLAYESIEWSEDRTELLKSRRNTLVSKAIGIKANEGGWGVAFDYVSHQGNCRVVTMLKDGSQMRMQHQDGIRDYWVGFAEP